jgi:putative tricarboxylic transport membrane protein
MELISHLQLGFAVAFSPNNLLYCLIGVVLGTAIGVLPGLGPLATIAMLLPITYSLEPTSALIMLAGIYYGASYGGSTTSILVNIPGEVASVVTCLDGHQMAKKGRAGAALAISALGSFFAGSVATMLVAALAPVLASVALSFGPTEYFSLMVLGLVASIILAQGSLLKALAMIVLGLILGSVGTDPNSGAQRFTFGILELSDGIEFVALAMGFFAFTDVILGAAHDSNRKLVTEKVRGLWLTREEFKASTPAVIRGSAVGSILGILPGGGGLLASFASYTVEKRLSKHPERFGTGVIEGVAGPESANNAGAQTSFIPMLTLGIPSNGVMALMIGAMMIHGIQPGPQVMTANPDLFWGLIASMWIGNLMLLVFNLPLISVWVWLLRVRYNVLYPIILVFCSIGLFGIQNSVFQIYLAAAFGVLGYFLHRWRCEAAPLMLGFILGPMMEENLRRAMLLSRGDASTFLTHPTSAVLLLASVVLLFTFALPALRRKRAEIFVDE